jgi:serine/threonine protein kinase
MAELRHGSPANLDGWLQKEGKYFKSRYQRYLKLRGSVLSNHHNEESPATWKVNVMDCKVSVGSRANELVIELPQRKVSFFAVNESEHKRWTAALKRASASSVEDFYTLGKILGEGAFAQVLLGVDKETGESFAIKVIKKKACDPKEMDFLLREVQILKSVSHENIVNTHDVFDTNDRLNLVLEFMEGGELFDIIADAGHFSEQAASQVMRDIVKGVQYLHMHNIVHRDLKPENVLCRKKEWPLQVKIADFGLANFAEDGSIQESTAAGCCMVGTPGYVAPEVVKREAYGPPVDMWACGVLLYIMLSGKMPFYGKDDSDCLRKIAAGQYSMPDREWKSISTDAKSLVKSLLQVVPEKRLTANAALQHNFLAQPNALSNEPIANDLKGIHSSRRKFKKAVMAAVSVERMKDIMAKNLEASNATTGL